VRNHKCLRCVVAFVLIGVPVLAKAQFQAPTDEELKMTADAKAPGAAAVYLNIEEIADDPTHYQTFYARIKVLTEKGKELATVEVPYLKSAFKVTEIKARTIHSDGTVVPLVGKPEDLLIIKSTDREIGRMVFTLPSVEVGCILEYKYQLSYDDNLSSSPMWEIQRPYFVHKAHYMFTPFKAFMPNTRNNNLEATGNYLTDAHGDVINSLLWWHNLPKDAAIKTDLGGHFSLDVVDVPPAPDEEWMPPANSYLYKVFFYYKNAFTAQEFWVHEAKRWSKEVDQFAEVSKALRSAVAGLTAPTDSEIDKAKKLYAAVQALDNTDYSRKKSESELKQLKLKEAKRAEDTWTQKSGTSEDIAMLYLAMARAAGLQAYAMKVVDHDQGIFDVSYMNINQLDDTLVILSIGGNDIVVDPGEKMCPFQTVSWKHASAGGLRQSAKEVGAAVSPEETYTNNSTTRTGDISVDAHGGITGTVQIAMAGQEALRWRQAALQNDETELKKQFDHSLETIMPEGVEGHVDHFAALDQPNEKLVATVTMKGTLGAATSKRLLLPGFLFEARGHQPFVSQENRLESVDMHYGERLTDQVTYHLPAGLTVESAPMATTIPWTGHAAYIVKTAASPGKIIIARTLARAFTLAKPEEYQDLRGFYQKIATADQAQVVLTAAPEAKGN